MSVVIIYHKFTMVTTDHGQIQKWVVKHSGIPQIIDAPDALGDKRGIRVKFPRYEEKYLNAREINEIHEWNEFFSIFEREQLAMEIDEGSYRQDPSMSYRFIKRDQVNNYY